MREAWRIDTDSALAERLQTSRQNISKWRSRNSVPYAEAIYTSNFCDVSLDWLLKGKGEKALPYTPPKQTLDVELIQVAIVQLLEFGILRLRDEEDEQKRSYDIEICAQAIASQYATILKTAHLLTTDNHMTPAEARKVAIHAARMAGSGDPTGATTSPESLRPRTRREGAQ
jgi:transcriptional regulator with XRE-family HTH domain